MNGKRLMAMGLIVTLGVSTVACGKEETAAEVSKVSVEVQNPELGDLSLDTAYIGSVSPQEQVYVIPKASGTVTQVNFAVGDTVKEGDVLFKIDDEAAQLQMASAKAAYDAAEAGVAAQSGGARDLQNYQTERQIQQLRDTLNDTDGTIEDMEDNLGDVRDAQKQVASYRDQAQTGVDALQSQEVSLTAELKNLQSQKTDLEAKLEVAEDQEKENISTQIEEVSKAITSKNNEIGSVQNQIKDAQAKLNQLQAQVDSLEATKTQLKSGIESAEDGMDTIRDNLTTAEQAYAITQNEIYPQSDAASAAQLQQASVGIDSAKMQLDFCTVEAPISGVVEAVNVEKNGMAAAGNAAFIISNKESMTVTFQVAEKAKNALAVGDHVTVERNGETFDGTITEVGTMANQQTKLFLVKASVAGAGESLPNGVTVKVYATTQKAEDQLLIPYDAVYFAGADSYVYCVENDTLVKKSVALGLMNDTDVVVEDGLTADDLVVGNWSSRLRDGAAALVVSVNGETVESESAVSGEQSADDTEEAE